MSPTSAVERESVSVSVRGSELTSDQIEKFKHMLDQK